MDVVFPDGNKDFIPLRFFSLMPNICPNILIASIAQLLSSFINLIPNIVLLSILDFSK